MGTGAIWEVQCFSNFPASYILSATENCELLMAYIDDIIIATETVEDHMDLLRDVFECLREATVKMRVANCNLRKSEIK